VTTHPDDHDEVIGGLDHDIGSIRGHPRTESMLLTWLQSFSGPGELVYVSSKLGLHVAQELRKGSNLILAT
jgi:hypothetical protein